MTDIDVSKIKRGDVVGVRVVDIDLGSMTANVGIQSNGLLDMARLNLHAIVSHTPAPKPALKVGDRVRHPDSFHPDREIIWIEHDRAFLRPVNPDYMFAPGVPLSEVETWERLS